MKFGQFDLSIVSDCTFRLDGGAMFGVVPKTLWSRVTSPDERNRIFLGANCVLVRADGKTIVIETGMGDKTSEKFNKIYAVERPSGLIQALAQQGVTAADVDTVINSHLHFDHCGGNTRKNDAGEVVATFPNAEYLIQRIEYEHALNPTDRDRASYLPENFEPLSASGQLKLVEGETEVVPGVELVPMPGHSSGQQCVRLRSEGRTAFFLADMVPTAAHLPYAWIMGYDLFPLTTLEQKKEWLPRAAEERWLCLFPHDHEMPAAYLAEQDGRMIAEKAGELELAGLA